jgi:hypothetical protein
MPVPWMKYFMNWREGRRGIIDNAEWRMKNLKIRN